MAKKPSKLIPNNRIQKLVDRQLDTYHHLQNLAIGALGAIVSILAVIAALGVPLVRFIPSIPWSETSIEARRRIFLEWSMSETGATLSLIINYSTTIFGVALAAIILSQSIHLFWKILANGRLQYSEVDADSEMVSLSRKDVAVLGIEPNRPEIVSWVQSNAADIDEADLLFRLGMYRIPISFGLLGVFGYIHLLSSRLAFLGILSMAVNITMVILVGFYLYRSRELELEVAFPTKAFTMVLLGHSIGQILLIFVDLANLVSVL